MRLKKFYLSYKVNVVLIHRHNFISYVYLFISYEFIITGQKNMKKVANSKNNSYVIPQI